MRSTISSLRDALRRWMVCYVLLGLVQSGMMPIILPPSGRPGPKAGLTYAAFAASGIVAPFVGAWSDKHRKHRRTLAFGLGLAGLALLADMLPGGMSRIAECRFESVPGDFTADQIASVRLWLPAVLGFAWPRSNPRSVGAFRSNRHDPTLVTLSLSLASPSSMCSLRPRT